jgi:NIMA-interacting peptidyl-prolyl cis-trans isomerase 4
MEALKELTGFTDPEGKARRRASAARKPAALTRTQRQVVEPVRFNLVAQKYSEDKAKDGGLLGWKRREELNGTFADVAFKLGKGKARCATR